VSGDFRGHPIFTITPGLSEVHPEMERRLGFCV